MSTSALGSTNEDIERAFLLETMELLRKDVEAYSSQLFAIQRYLSNRRDRSHAPTDEANARVIALEQENAQLKEELSRQKQNDTAAKYERLKIKFLKLREQLDASSEKVETTDRTWRNCWASLISLVGIVRVCARVAPEGLVTQSPRSMSVSREATPQTIGSSGGHVRVDHVYRRDESTVEVCRHIVQSYLPSILCNSNVVVCFYGGKGCARSSHAHECTSLFLEQLKERFSAVHLDAQVMDDDDIWSLSSSSIDDVVTAVFHERRNHYQDCNLVVSLSVSVAAGSVTIVDMVPQSADGNCGEFLSMVSAVKQINHGAQHMSYETSIPLCSVLFRKLTVSMPQLLFVGVVAPQRAAAESWQTLQLASKVRTFGQLKNIEFVSIDHLD